MKFFLTLLLSTNLILSTLFISSGSNFAFTQIPCRSIHPYASFLPDKTSDASVAVSGKLSVTSNAMADETQAFTEASSAEIQNADSTTPGVVLNVSAPSVLLMEASTGTVVYEKNSHEVLRPASITKIMTLILIFDALSTGQITLDDTVTVSEYAASMGGSQVFLEPGETQTVDAMIKCISIASANDACVAMAELISGSETEFVRMMNERAKGLGMKDTTFVNCCGLDVDGHTTSAYDVALMSRELITKYPDIHNYCTIWMENITHTTKKGTSEFGLTNTNKLIKQYPYATGLKTGSTSLAKYCVSATAEKDGMKLIAVIMAAPDYKIRFADATTLLNYGFGKCRIYAAPNDEPLTAIPVKKGISESAGLAYQGAFQYVSTDGADLSGVTKVIELPDEVNAPVKKNDVAGKVVYSLNGREIGSVNILFMEDVAAATYRDYFSKALKHFLT